jgi:hypothetical protein
MAIASHLGPWLLGTVKNTTGTTAGTIRNMGFTQVMQTSPIASTDGANTQLFVLPAGAIIFEIYIYQSGAKYTSGTTGTVTLSLNGTAFAVASISGAGAEGIIGVNPTTAAQTLTFTNVGTTDAIITATNATLTGGSGVIVITYGVRNADGTFNPTSYTA